MTRVLGDKLLTVDLCQNKEKLHQKCEQCGQPFQLGNQFVSFGHGRYTCKNCFENYFFDSDDEETLEEYDLVTPDGKTVTVTEWI